MANETQIIITAVTAQAEASLRTLGQSVSGVSRQMLDMSGVAGTLAGALSLTAFAGMIKHSIDAADELNNLSIKTGTSVEQLAGLKYAAEQSDTSLQAVAGAAKKLSTNMAENPAIFKKFGIDAKDSTGALIQLANIFSAMPDGVEKTALAVKLMGKSGEEMIPFLNQGGDAIQTLVNHGMEYNPVTAESARLAADFNDNLKKLQDSAGKAGMAMTNELLPQLTQISEAMAQAARDSGLLKSLWVGLGGLGTAVFTDEMLTRSAQIERRITSINDQIKSAEGMRGIATPISIPLHIERGNLERELADIRKSAEDAARKPVADMSKTGDGKGAQLACEISGGKWINGKCIKPETGKSKVDQNETTLASMQSELFRKQMEEMGVSAEQTKVYELAMKGATRAQIEEAQAIADSIAPIKAKLEAEKQAKKQIEDFAKGSTLVSGMKKDFEIDLAKKNRTLNDAMTSAADKQHADNLDGVSSRTARLRDELEKSNLTQEAQLHLLNAINQAESDQRKGLEELRLQVDKNNASWEYGANVALRNYLDEISNVAKQSEGLFSRAFKGMEDSLVNFVKTGKLDFKSLADSIITDLIRMQIQKSIMQPMMSAGGDWLSTILPAFIGGVTGGGTSAQVSSAPVSQYSLSSGGSSIGMRASGGPVDKNSLYQVNERGPELLNMNGNDYLMMGGQGGFVKPLGAPVQGASQQNSGAITVMVNVNAQTGETKTSGGNADLNGLGTRIGSMVREIMVQEKRPGGVLA